MALRSKDKESHLHQFNDREETDDEQDKHEDLTSSSSSRTWRPMTRGKRIYLSTNRGAKDVRVGSVVFGLQSSAFSVRPSVFGLWPSDFRSSVFGLWPSVSSLLLPAWLWATTSDSKLTSRSRRHRESRIKSHICINLMIKKRQTTNRTSTKSSLPPAAVEPGGQWHVVKEFASPKLARTQENMIGQLLDGRTDQNAPIHVRNEEDEQDGHQTMPAGYADWRHFSTVKQYYNIAATGTHQVILYLNPLDAR